MAGWKNGQTLFHRTIVATAGSPTSITAADWHLEVKYIEYDVGLTKIYCVIANIQKNPAQFIYSFLKFSRFLDLMN